MCSTGKDTLLHQISHFAKKMLCFVKMTYFFPPSQVSMSRVTDRWHHCAIAAPSGGQALYDAQSFVI